MLWASLGATTKPMAFPARRGRRIEVAGCAKTCAGSVREGMKVVMMLESEVSTVSQTAIHCRTKGRGTAL